MVGRIWCIQLFDLCIGLLCTDKSDFKLKVEV